MSHALFFRLRESSNPRPKGHIEMGSTLTTNWATSSVGSESAPHFNMSLWSWVRALTEAKKKGMGHAPIACEWDHPSSEWARGWGPYKEHIGRLEPNSFKRTTCPRISAILHFRFGRPGAYGLGEEPIFGLISLHL